MGSRTPLRPGAEYKYQVGQIWEFRFQETTPSLVRLKEFDHEIVNGIEMWLVERLALGEQHDVRFLGTMRTNTSWLKHGPFNEMEVLAWAARS